MWNITTEFLKLVFKSKIYSLQSKKGQGWLVLLHDLSCESFGLQFIHIRNFLSYGRSGGK